MNVRQSIWHMFVKWFCCSINAHLNVAEWRHIRLDQLAMASSIPSSSFGTPPSILSIQELAKQPMATVPQIFLLEDQERPLLLENASLPDIPTIDMKRLIMSVTTDFELDKLHSACKEWGFFQVFLYHFHLFIYSLIVIFHVGESS